jgi:hypothetical protein
MKCEVLTQANPVQAEEDQIKLNCFLFFFVPFTVSTFAVPIRRVPCATFTRIYYMYFHPIKIVLLVLLVVTGKCHFYFYSVKFYIT